MLDEQQMLDTGYSMLDEWHGVLFPIQYSVSRAAQALASRTRSAHRASARDLNSFPVPRLSRL
jgi:hypothetical protein